MPPNVTITNVNKYSKEKTIVLELSIREKCDKALLYFQIVAHKMEKNTNSFISSETKPWKVMLEGLTTIFVLNLIIIHAEPWDCDKI